MTVPANSRAMASASADLPLAVGPATTTSRRAGAGGLLAAAAPAIVGAMDLVLTLVTNPDTRCLDKADVATARAALAAIGATTAAPDWLAPDLACDIAFAGAPPPLAQAAVAAALAHRPIDLHAQPAAGRRKRLLVADMDSTIVTSETLDELAEHAGIKEEIAAITRRSMNGELDFATALRERVAMTAGLPVEALAATLARTELTAGAVALVRTMRAGGAHTALVS